MLWSWPNSWPDYPWRPSIWKQRVETRSLGGVGGVGKHDQTRLCSMTLTWWLWRLWAAWCTEGQRDRRGASAPGWPAQTPWSSWPPPQSRTWKCSNEFKTIRETQQSTCWTGTPCSRRSQGRTSSTTSRRWRGRRRRGWCTPGSRRARGAGRGARWQGRRCWGRPGSRSTRTSTGTCRSSEPPSASYGSTWNEGLRLGVCIGTSHFSKLFVRFCHAVCRVCLRGFRVSSVTLAVTVTENMRNV